ncbi:MAG: DNA-directed RNA polymerase subunit delta [Bacilli bacterium]|nr:DNA-directed RNA polymerase subunit delta [Bacilli bacterium]MDD3896112.1 DNA-directed RNA polymerase subunit delta [Bacilli bacterium]MDD4407462.1 DNA-directed RNA polymerase subunit delta [Bacilli bacterium]
MKIKLTQEEIDTKSYDDVAYLILESSKKKIKIQELFKSVIKAMKLSEEEFTNDIADFFELLITDKRFIMLENGYWDLKINHNTKVLLEDEEEDEEIDINLEEEEIDIEEEDTEINYDEDDSPDDEDDGLENLIVLDEEDQENI